MTDILNTPLHEIFDANVDWNIRLVNTPTLKLAIKKGELARDWLAAYAQRTASIYSKETPLKITHVEDGEKRGIEWSILHSKIAGPMCMYGVSSNLKALGDREPHRYDVLARADDNTLHVVPDGMGSGRPAYVNMFLDTPVMDCRIDFAAQNPQYPNVATRAVTLEAVFNEIAPMLLEQGIYIMPAIFADGFRQPDAEIPVIRDSTTFGMAAYVPHDLCIEFSLSPTELIMPAGKWVNMQHHPVLDDVTKHDRLDVMKRIYAYQRANK